MGSDIKITPDSIIADIVRNYPQCIEVFKRHNMPCLACMGSSSDTIGGGALMHDVDIDKIISELNECCVRADDGNQTA